VKLILVRHGQTPSNVAGLLDTAPPGPGLTETGLLQAEAVPAALAAQPIDAIFASNQTRAQQTAAPLAIARRLEVSVLAGLREVGAGDLEMAGDADSVHRYIGTLISWLDGDLRSRIPGGPNGFDFLERYDAAVATIADGIIGAAGPNGVAVAVSHGAAIRAWAAIRAANPLATAGPGLGHRHLDNTGAVMLEGDGNGAWQVLDWRTEALGSAVVGGGTLDQPEASGPAT
jgi:probable phosphoglycerate mutase